MMTIQLDTVFWQRRAVFSHGDILAYESMCNVMYVGMYYSYTEDDSAQSIAASRPQRAAANHSQ